MASIAGSACGDWSRTNLSRKSCASGWRVNAMAESRTETNHASGDGPSMKRLCKALNASGERSAARAKAASAAMSSPAVRKRLIHAMAPLPSMRRIPPKQAPRTSGSSFFSLLFWAAPRTARRRSNSAAAGEPTCSTARAASTRTDLSSSANSSIRVARAARSLTSCGTALARERRCHEECRRCRSDLPRQARVGCGACRAEK